MNNGKWSAALMAACCLLSGGCQNLFQFTTGGAEGCNTSTQFTSPTSCDAGGYEALNPPVYHQFYVNGVAPDNLLEVALTSEPSPRRGTQVLSLSPGSPIYMSYSAKVRMKATPDDPSVTAIVSAWPSTDGYKVVAVDDKDIGAVVVRNGETVQIPDPHSTRKYIVGSSFSYIKFIARYERAVPGEKAKRELVTSYSWLVVDYKW